MIVDSNINMIATVTWPKTESGCTAGFQHITVGTFLYGLCTFVISPSAWLGCCTVVAHFVFKEPVEAVWRLCHSKEIWACNYLDSGENMRCIHGIN